ncbi:MAG: hypothetical protein JSV50_10010 [Desulfobacteraceae bacterium]|nr:MAG: hypothetical protein JSV50_10010 [Desulfobacteraceae bacterium]
MKKWAILFLTLLFGLSSSVYAQSNAYTFSNRGGLYVELGGRSDPDSIGGELGIYAYASEHFSLRVGLAFLASESVDDVFAGGNLGARYNFGKRFSPFIGFGVFAGYSEETLSAENDGIDNDYDGYIDEFGEEKEVVDNVIGSIYPELGIHFWGTDTTRFTFTGKYFITTEG